jgi:hypothetical protein
MHDEHAQFVIAVAELFVAAETGQLVVDVITGTGERARGVPRRVRAAQHADEAEDTGYARVIQIQDRAVDLLDIVECTICAPGAGAGEAASIAR